MRINKNILKSWYLINGRLQGLTVLCDALTKYIDNVIVKVTVNIAINICHQLLDLRTECSCGSCL